MAPSDEPKPRTNRQPGLYKSIEPALLSFRRFTESSWDIDILGKGLLWVEPGLQVADPGYKASNNFGQHV